MYGDMGNGRVRLYHIVIRLYSSCSAPLPRSARKAFEGHAQKMLLAKVHIPVPSAGHFSQGDRLTRETGTDFELSPPERNLSLRLDLSHYIATVVLDRGQVLGEDPFARRIA